jgi:hypothetical protein
MFSVTFKRIAGAAALGVASQFAMANTVATTDPDCNIAVGVVHLFTVTATTVNKCLYAAGGNINGTGFADDIAMAAAGWSFIDAPAASLFSFTGVGTTSGTFTFGASAYSVAGTVYAIGLKSGDNFAIDHAIFSLSTGTMGGSFSISPDQGGALSHMILWTKDGSGGGGGSGSGQMPEPSSTALALLGLGLLGAGFRARASKRA